VVHNTFFAIECIKQIIEKDPDATVLIIVPKNVILETVWYSELVASGINLKDIGVYYGNIKEPAKITITNMQSAGDLLIEDYTMIVADETHWYGTEKNIKYLSHNNKYKMGLSATLERLDNKHYDIMEKFDYRLFKYQIEEALADDVISFFNLTTIGLDLDLDTREEYEEYNEKINFIYQAHGSYTKIMRSGNSKLITILLSLMNQRKKLVNNYKRKFDVMKAIISKNPNDKILVFNQFNSQTNDSYWHLLEDGINAKVMHSNIAKKDRENILTDYKNDRFNVLLTSKVLDEGYSLPSINTAILMSNDSSGKRQLIQRIGRTLRKKKDGSMANVYYIYVNDSIEENNDNIDRLKRLASKIKQYNFNEYEEIIL
jgi:superfamily II DNA or RNA helicase